MYASNDDLPFVCRINLPEEAQQVYRDAFNAAWRSAPDGKERHRAAQMQAWSEVRRTFERDRLSGRWVPRMSQRVTISQRR